MLALDEATSSLDREMEASISEPVYTLRGSITVVILASRLSTVKNADKVVYLSNGKGMATRTFEEVRKAVPNFDYQPKITGL